MRSLLAGLFIFFLPIPALAAIAFDNSGIAGANSGLSITLSLTTAGTNPALFVCASNDATGVAPTATYGGVSMTNVSHGLSTGGGGAWINTFILTGYTPGTANIVVTWPSGNAHMNLIGSSYDGVNQATPVTASTTQASQSGTTVTDTVSVSTANSWLADCVRGSDATLSSGSGTTARQNNTVTGIGDSNGTVGTGSQSLNWTFSPSQFFATTIIALAPVAAPAAAAPTSPLFFLTWW